MRSIATCFGLMLLVGCGGGDLCSRLQGSGGNCDRSTTKDKCEAAISSAKAADPSCAPMIDALAACLAPLKLSCTSSSSISANGDDKFEGPRNYSDVGGFDVVVQDTNCSRYRRGLEACRTCPTAAGAKEVEALGIGDRCPGTGGSCATGLSCQSGICTRACTSDDDCSARADDCKLRSQYPNICSGGKCTLRCGSEFICQEFMGSSSTCVKDACTF